MKLEPHYLSSAELKHLGWRVDTPIAQLSLPAKLKPWLCDTGSLTEALMGIAGGTFRVQLLSQGLQVPLWHEQIKLGRPLSLIAMVRQVNLCIHGEPVVFARSVIPLSHIGRGGLAALGNKPLGHLLFKDGRIRISRRDFASCRVIDSSSKINDIYARRTPYDYLGESILVSEYFLPGINKYL